MEYQHGGDIYGNPQIELDYSVNVSPLGLPEGVREAACRAISESSRYPDSLCRKLRWALGRHYGLSWEWIVCGNGAADLLFALVNAKKPQRALLFAPTFQEYECALRAVNCEIEVCFLQEEEQFVCGEAYFRQLESQKYDMVFLCNPNNPTGTVMTRSQVQRVAKLCQKQQAFLVVDECFCDFLQEEEEVTALPLLEEFPNLLVLRAFTKLYAMAGLRLGYAFCRDAELIEALHRVRQPWSVSHIAQEAGLAALKEKEYVRQVKDLLMQEKPFLESGLRALGFLVYSGRANYILFALPKEKREEERKQPYLYEAMKEQGILIRDCRNYRGLDGGYYRICVGKREDNQRVLAALRKALASLDTGTKE
ncbi:MAG: pyridoxal phosphate-dependent class II aminotransferase [bacterium]|nr:pyridoxal phosphate-dependent class II aminotransferase [bacterium]